MKKYKIGSGYLAGFMMLFLVTACTGSGQLSETLTPKPVAAQSEQTETQNSDPISENALAAEEPASPAENVAAAQTRQLAALDTANAMTFLPVQGAPQGKVTELSRSLKNSAASYGLAVLPSTQSGASYQVKGYFSALNDGSGTLLIYIWDIMDRNGKRLHRINGQERTSSIKSDPWQAITDEELARVADATAQRLKSWVETN
ncbi:MAG: hypothetical protein AAGA76_12920 [Pseudomonadota bacterium]